MIRFTAGFLWDLAKYAGRAAVAYIRRPEEIECMRASDREPGMAIAVYGTCGPCGSAVAVSQQSYIHAQSLYMRRAVYLCRQCKEARQ